jgi:sulfate/thiosulfate transport system substrate-binding protein
VSRLALLLAALLVAGVATAARAALRAADEELTLVAYSTPRETLHELIRDFASTPEGAHVGFGESYGSSGEQSRAVVGGLPADLVVFSLAPDMTRLVDAELVDPGWADDVYGGMLTRSVVVLVVREGNPKGIRGWDDLVRRGVEVLTPNPFSSGGARWNVMAAYGAKRAQGASHEEGVDYLHALFRNVSVQDKSARESLQTFAGGKGDVLIAYENEAILARAKGEPLEYVVPERTILIENPAAVTAGSTDPRRAGAFLRFLRSEHAQRVFAEAGYRPVHEGVEAEAGFPTPGGLFTIEDVGGWNEVQERFFDRESGIFAEVQRRLGDAR